MIRKQIESGSARRMLEFMQRVYPGFETDKDMNVQCFVNMAHVLGVVAAYMLHNQGERALDKAVAMVAAIVKQQAYEGDELIRQKKSLLVNLNPNEKSN